MNDGDSGQRFCSFCGGESLPSRRLVAGPGICICEDCVAKAGKLLAEPTGGAPRAHTIGPAWDRMSNEEILDHLPEVTRVSEELGAQLRLWVGAARERNISWSRIGEALGITRQTAWERFKAVD